MKKLALVFAIALPGLVFAGGPSVLSAIVPQFVEGTTTSTNNNRVPFWFWGEINGLIPNATYHYFVSLDTLNSASTSNGAGLPYLVNAGSSSIRRILNPSMSSNTGYDSLVADSLGVIRGWFGVEPTANGRFLAGTTVYPKIMLNDGAGGTTVLMRLLFAGTPVTVLSFGTTSMSTTQGSALWDSLNAAPQNFICLYDNVAATGRPISIAIVENDGMSLLVPSTANFYKVKVDSLDYHWGTIIPNNLANGVRALQERDFTTADPIDTVTDSDGIWCFGTNTVNMSNGNIAKFLNSTFVLTGSAMMPDTTWTGFTATFTATSNSPNSTYTWNFGDTGTGSGATVTHMYTIPGIMDGQVIINTGGCSDTINQTVVVMLTTGVIAPMPLSFQLMPNPTNGEILITTKENNEKLVTVTNLLGQTISSEILTGNKVSVDLTGQAPGIYLVEVRDKVTQKSGVKKIVLQ